VSRPPRPHPRRVLTASRPGSQGLRDYLPREHADFLESQQRLAREELGIVSSHEEGDFARTLMDMSAVLAHVLGLYQDRYALESFLGTAQSAHSLVQHGRRLGYEPDPGLAATGFVVLTLHPRLEGVVRQGLALTSSPFGEKKAQHYETLEDVRVDWRHNALKVARTLPGDEVVRGGVEVEGELPALAPGQYVLLSTLDDQVHEVAALSAVQVVVDPQEPKKPRTALTWSLVEREGVGHVWRRGDLKLRGNVVPLSHGKAAEQVLGDSDGTQPFLRFALQEPRVTHLPVARRAEPVLEVRVAGMPWTRVEDLLGSGPDDRHYLLQRDEHQRTHVLFGDGRQGAIPPAGKRHITASYRVGLGVLGNAEPGQVSRIPRAHPLVARAVNPLPIHGGAEPAGAREVRTQATRFIKTFGRAISVQDHADLALLFPGVARASARWMRLPSGQEGLLLVVASSTAEPLDLDTLQALRAFLDARRDTGLPLEVRAPTPLDLQLELFLEVHPDHLVEVVKRNLRDALLGERPEAPGLFTFQARELGQPVFLSHVYEALEDVPGVAFLAVTRLGLEGSPQGVVNDGLSAEPHQWLRLRPANLSFQVF
jgi:hypothetical protein